MVDEDGQGGQFNDFTVGMPVERFYNNLSHLYNVISPTGPRTSVLGCAPTVLPVRKAVNVDVISLLI